MLSILHTVAKTGMNAKISGKYSSRLTDESFAFINIHIRDNDSSFSSKRGIIFLWFSPF